jgi:hypothetical protein
MEHPLFNRVRTIRLNPFRPEKLPMPMVAADLRSVDCGAASRISAARSAATIERFRRRLNDFIAND